MESNNTNVAMGLLVSGVMYTGWGLIAAFIYAMIAPEFGMPIPSLAALLGAWWLWFFFFVPPIIFLVSTLSSSFLVTSVKERTAKEKESA